LRSSFRARAGFAVLSGLLVAGVLSTPAAAAATTGIIGTLTDPSGQPLAYSYVTVQNVDGETHYAFTDDTGSYSADVAPGAYRVSFVLPAGTQWAHQRITAAEASTFTVAEGARARQPQRPPHQAGRHPAARIIGDAAAG
jgi:hypothetical protein